MEENWAWWCTPNYSRIMVQASLGKKVRPYLENNLKQKRLEMWLKW
jgi:hypothetical protein